MYLLPPRCSLVRYIAPNPVSTKTTQNEREEQRKKGANTQLNSQYLIRQSQVDSIFLHFSVNANLAVKFFQRDVVRQRLREHRRGISVQQQRILIEPAIETLNLLLHNTELLRHLRRDENIRIKQRVILLFHHRFVPQR